MESLGASTATETQEKIYDSPEMDVERVDETTWLVKGKNPEMQNIVRLSKKVSESELNVLLLGESGVGKEVLARLIHNYSGRRNKPFFAINCAALTETLIETELFGCEQGAFTDATKMKIGKLEANDGGTIFLDEIEAASPALQQKLLRVIEYKVLQRVGGVKNHKINIRFIAASNIDLKMAVEEKRFREDLFYRLSFTIAIPPLRHRIDDIPCIAYHILLKKFGALNTNKEPWQISADAMNCLQNADWRGNVRELDNALMCAVIRHSDDDKIIRPDDLAPFLNLNKSQTKSKKTISEPYTKTEKTLKDIGNSAKEEAEKVLIRKALDETNWNRKESARRLKISYKMLLNKIKKWKWQKSISYS